MFKSYMDDVRLLLSKIVKEYKFEPDIEEMICDPAYEEKYGGISAYQYSSMILLQVMNNVASDMCFTMENQCEYPDKRLPTGFQSQINFEGHPQNSIAVF